MEVTQATTVVAYPHSLKEDSAPYVLWSNRRRKPSTRIEVVYKYLVFVDRMVQYPLAQATDNGLVGLPQRV